ncbi:hypothetical protein KI809_15110 [Geobacter pelophilus]|uniref:BIG2 domain-containing protein n=1 Tax=Geoanaerobacter pelophilus TaxID=60036 RepID=A0AAW4L7W3_9BACT|nr:hypothetical protein [Geoanaerobacter pelophilus]MBT0665637.1 hypothetical protein [Geoanaerobacter pelophilus]
MKLLRIIFLVFICMSLFGCGDDGKVGSLTLGTPFATNNGDGTYQVGATATYSNPSQSNLVGVSITFKLIDTATNTIISTFSDTTPTNGSFGCQWTVPQQLTPQGFLIVASSGGLEDTKSVSVPALGVLSVASSSITFTNTEPAPTIKQNAISGGTTPYSASSSNAALATVSVSGNAVSVTRASNATGTVIVTVTDASPTRQSTSFSVVLQ